jgi:hypothetical protein
MTENIVSKPYKVLTDATNKIWGKISYWKKASDVYNDNGKSLEEIFGGITGVTSSLSTASNTLIANAYAIKQLNDKLEALSI